MKRTRFGSFVLAVGFLFTTWGAYSAYCQDVERCAMCTLEEMVGCGDAVIAPAPHPGCTPILFGDFCVDHACNLCDGEFEFPHKWCYTYNDGTYGCIKLGDSNGRCGTEWTRDCEWDPSEVKCECPEYGGTEVGVCRFSFCTGTQHPVQ